MKTKVFITAMALVVTMGLATAQNQNQAKKETAKTTQNRPAFVDKNNNAVCDNFENGTPRNPNANGKQRLFDGSGRGQGKSQGLRNGRGQGKGMRDGRGQGPNFVDSDKDGICDRREK